MTLQQIMYFQAVVNNGSYAKAAREMYVTQPALSYAIQTLENELDAPLLIREKGKDLRLTPYGKTLLSYAKQLTDTMNNCMDEIKSIKSPYSGIVSVCFAYTASSAQIIDMLLDFQKEEIYRDIRIDITHVDSKHSSYTDPLDGGLYDIAFLSGEESIQDEKEIHAVRMFDQNIVVLMPDNHPLAKRTFLTIEDIQNELLVSYHPDLPFYSWVSDVFAKNGTTMNVSSYVAEWSACTFSVAIGNGIAITPEMDIPYEKRHLKTIPFVVPASAGRWSTYMIWQKSSRLKGSVKELVDFCRAYSKE